MDEVEEAKLLRGKILETMKESAYPVQILALVDTVAFTIASHVDDLDKRHETWKVVSIGIREDLEAHESFVTERLQ